MGAGLRVPRLAYAPMERTGNVEIDDCQIQNPAYSFLLLIGLPIENFFHCFQNFT